MERSEYEKDVVLAKTIIKTMIVMLICSTYMMFRIEIIQRVAPPMWVWWMWMVYSALKMIMVGRFVWVLIDEKIHQLVWRYAHK